MDHKHWTAPEQTCYRTGFTQPKKSKRGPIAVLLVLIIFFGGVNTVFRLLNIRLFREITQDAAIAPASVQFSGRTRSVGSEPELPPLGLTGKVLSPFEQQCYQMPSGFYITAVAAGSYAEKVGILPGDILLYLDSTPAADAEALKQELFSRAPGQTVNLKLNRNGTVYLVCLDLE